MVTAADAIRAMGAITKAVANGDLTPSEASELARLVDEGQLKVHVERTFPLERVREAHQFLTTQPKGKVVLTI